MKQYRTLNDGELVMAGDEFWGLDRTWIPSTEIGKKVTTYTHKMYRRPLTETSSQTTDTCPDCSNIPCDCGLPAGYEVDIRFAANFAPHIKVVEVSKVAEIIEQRDRLAGGLKWIAGWNHQLFDENTAMQMRDKAEQALQSLNQPNHEQHTDTENR